VVDTHATYGAAAAAMDSDDEPCHDSPTSSEITSAYEAAVACNSAASPSHAAAAANNEPAPGPE
jgi:hypothetical protein